jgi:steroid delta-isomerase-like uncharacterized protein
MDARELIEAYYLAFNLADWDGMLALLADDVVHDINQGGREIGVVAFRAFLTRMERCYAERLSDIVVLAAGERGAAEFIVHGTYKASDEGLPPAHGQRYSLPAGAFFEIHAGRIARVSNFYNLADWLHQVGA